MKIISTVHEMQAIAEDIRKNDLIGFVPTMGYLHEGHLALVRRARQLGNVTIASIFVNPIQFGPSEDLDKYPRDLDRDKALLEKEKTDILFFPAGTDMYPDHYSTFIDVKNIGDHLCGRNRVGHFTGVATVVAKLFNIVKPHFAVFGQKDFQQLKVIERMVKDLNMDVKIVSYPTVRESDGLAMSSRNTYLSPSERERALAINQSLKKAEKLVGDGLRNVAELKKAVTEILTSKEGVDIEYVSFCDTETLEDIDVIEKKALLAIACRVGKTRLIDNTILTEA